ncbi:hypothetical protein CEUSTIGMA_g3799.t1 [Chlamydomonas eustigma]|uniref:O-fucosyltransferase family protein n=1 Tax=Chlamydomonas eustigma TaxID=1157962 RepID=A0A250WZT2_9CHLO|nr:hypothetical protein CEUSTIGMA_g3799.t1 [Chlamydomonas eustigma]|eukprot:GAX76353.1 hypothetical protein CEUSTIGMA_g3799.t1 [Chlamydomonas eustigma]
MRWALHAQLFFATALLASRSNKALRYSDDDRQSEIQHETTSSSSFLPESANEYTWIAQYETFHKAQRLKPGARYLVHRADMNGKGLGDRLRSMIFTTRLAYASSRVVLFSWAQPFDATEFLSPAGDIDWRAAGTGYDPTSPHPRFKWINVFNNTWLHRFKGDTWNLLREPPRQVATGGGLLSMKDPFITIITNEPMDSDCVGCPTIDAWGPSAVQLWNKLFKVRPEIQELADQQYNRLFGASKLPYVAVHLRFGGMTGETELDSGIRTGTHSSSLQEVIAGMSCGRTLAAQLVANYTAGRGSALPHPNPILPKSVQPARLPADTTPPHSSTAPFVMSAKDGAVPERQATSSTPAHHNRDPAPPILLITDNDQLRNFVLSGGLAGVVTTDVKAVHLEKAGPLGLNKTAHYATFIDFILLGRSRCLVISPSGFSHQAFLMGGQSCKVHICDCFERKHEYCGVDPPSFWENAIKGVGVG